MIIAPATGTPLQNAVLTIDNVLVGVDLAGLKWTYKDFQGWWDPAPLRDRMVDRPSGDGAYDAPPLRSPRVVTVTGWVRGNSRSDVAPVADRLAGLLGDGSLGTFTVDDPDLGRRSVSVRLTGTPQVDASSMGAGVLRWMLAFKAPDHRKYGQKLPLSTGLRTAGGGLAYPLAYPLDYGTAPTGGRLVFTNSGNAPTEPVFTVTGPLASGFQITYVETGQKLIYSAAVGSDLTVDCAAGSASTQGQDRTVYLTQRDWFSVQKGAAATFAFASLGSETAASAPGVQLSGSLAPAYL